MAQIQAGDIAPTVELPLGGGGTWRSADHAGRPIVLYFYPKDDTEGCTAEAIDFSRLRPDFEAAGAVVIGISPDSPGRHARFAAKHGLDHALGADETRAAIESFGVWGEKSMFGRRYMGVERATFLIGRDGKVARAWRNVRVRGHAAEVLAAVRAL